MNAHRLLGTLLAPGSMLALFGQRQRIGSSIRRVWWHSGIGKSMFASYQFPGVLVLAYHGIRPRDVPASSMPFAPLHVPEDTFAAHCAFFSQHCTVLSAGDWLAVQRRQRPIPPRAVLLTFDDGYRTVLTHAVPRLRQFGLPAVFFVCSGPIQARQLHWYDALARKQGERAVAALRLGPYDRWQREVARLNRTSDNGDVLALMTPEEIGTLASMPGMTVGAHTTWHPPLAAASAAQQDKELSDCAHDLSAWTKRDVHLFAYPTGRRPEDYNDASVSAAKKAGFLSAFTTEEGFAHPDRPPLEQPRYTVVDGLTVPELAYRLAYLWE